MKAEAASIWSERGSGPGVFLRNRRKPILGGYPATVQVAEFPPKDTWPAALSRCAGLSALSANETPRQRQLGVPVAKLKSGRRVGERDYRLAEERGEAGEAARPALQEAHPIAAAITNSILVLFGDSGERLPDHCPAIEKDSWNNRKQQ